MMAYSHSKEYETLLNFLDVSFQLGVAKMIQPPMQLFHAS